ncbi:hypothetical protein [Colwellia asteriadis]|uniref:hypothetical protein n=1 Tax=Colwellia asteriadis TaxID=517723 RepID=UPI0031D835BA
MTIFLWQVVLSLLVIITWLFWLGWQLHLTQLCSDDNRTKVDSFIISNEGEIYFSKLKQTYQISDKTRTSTLGIWLVLTPLTTVNSNSVKGYFQGEHTYNLANNAPQKTLQSLFLFRDSMQRQDFSRVIKVIRNFHTTD